MDDQYLYGLSFLVVLANNADGNMTVSANRYHYSA